MTIDTERWTAIEWTRDFLNALMGDPGRMWPELAAMTVPATVRKIARSLAKHYPEAHWMERIQHQEQELAGWVAKAHDLSERAIKAERALAARMAQDWADQVERYRRVAAGEEGAFIEHMVCSHDGEFVKRTDFLAMRGELSDLQHTFDTMYAANMRGIKAWQEANPGNDLVWPDHAALVTWLIERKAVAELKLDSVIAERDANIRRLMEHADSEQKRAAAAELALEESIELEVQKRIVTERARASHAVQLMNNAEVRAGKLEAALQLIAAPQRADGTWNRDREACRVVAQYAIDGGALP